MDQYSGNNKKPINSFTTQSALCQCFSMQYCVCTTKQHHFDTLICWMVQDNQISMVNPSKDYWESLITRTLCHASICMSIEKNQQKKNCVNRRAKINQNSTKSNTKKGQKNRPKNKHKIERMEIADTAKTMRQINVHFRELFRWNCQYIAHTIGYTVAQRFSRCFQQAIFLCKLLASNLWL